MGDEHLHDDNDPVIAARNAINRAQGSWQNKTRKLGRPFRISRIRRSSMVSVP
jgi:hypothetical protein